MIKEKWSVVARQTNKAILAEDISEEPLLNHFGLFKLFINLQSEC
jgi:hypothetical protein